MKFKLTYSEKKWVWYDVGNSAFTLLVCTIIPIYFNTLAENAGISETDYLAYFGYATSASTLIVALMGPTLGTLSDISGLRKKIFSVCPPAIWSIPSVYRATMKSAFLAENSIISG